MLTTNGIEVLVIGLVLSTDSFSAALAMGTRPHKLRDTLKFALTSGGAEALVTFLGAMVGEKFFVEFDFIDHWISFSLLTAVALHIAYEGFIELKNRLKKEKKTRQFHSFLKVIIVSFATSLDAFAVGISLGVSGKSLVPYITSIGFFAFLSTIVGMSVAKLISKKVAPISNFVASVVLIVLAVKFLFEGI
jgi:putative Mn2+ efflux pump MntP